LTSCVLQHLLPFSLLVILKLKSLTQDCVIAMGIVLVALLLMLRLDPWLGMIQTPFLLFFGAVPIAALYLGRQGGMIATVLCALFANYFFIPPIHSFALDVVGSGRTLIFLLEGTLISILIGALRRVQQKTKENLRQLEASETDRKQLLQQLTSERALFEAVLSQMPEGVMIADAASGNLVLANEQANQILQHTHTLNLKLEQYQLSVPFQIYGLDGRSYLTDEYPLLRSLRTGEVIRHEEMEIRYPNDRCIFIDANSSPVFNRHGEIMSAVVVFQDITQRKQTEASLRQSEERLRVALKSAPINTFSQDRELRYTWIENPTLNYQADQILGKKDSDFIAAEEATMLTRIKRQVLETGIGTREEVKLTSMGQEFYYDLTVEPLQDAKGNVTGVICAAIDISELKQTELALRQSEERFRLLAERVQIIPWESDAVTGQFTYVGPQAVEILGYPVEAWYTENFWVEHIYAPDRQSALEFCQESSLALDNYDFEYRMLTTDGRIVWLYDVVNVVRYENKPKLLRGIMIDITQRKRQEEAQQYLAEVSKVLASSLDYQTTLNQFTQQMVPHLADWCVVHMLEADSIQTVATAHINPAKMEWANELRQRYPLSLDNPRGTAQVLRTGQSEIYPSIPDSLLVEIARDSEHLNLLRQIEFRSAMIIPMQAHGKTLGTLTLVTTESERAYDQFDLTLAEELARRAALAADNAQLYKKAQQAQEVAQQFAYRTAVLQQVTAAFSQALTPQQVADVVMQQGIETLGASAGSIALLVDQGTTLKILQATGYPELMLDQWSSFPLSAPVPLAETARTGKPLFLETSAPMLLKYPHLSDHITTTGHQAFVCLPLTVEERLIGVMGLSFAEPQAFQSEDQALMLTLAQQSAQAIARAYLYEAEQTARSEAEAANRVKDEFLAVLSHELRTPLNPILGWARLLQTQKMDAEKTARALATIERNAKLQVELIEDLLDVSRILRGKLVLNIAPVNLIAIIEAAKETVQLAAESKSIEIQTILPSTITAVSGDAARLQQVVWNLLSNAVKFTPSGGRVEIQLESVADEPAALHRQHESHAQCSYAQITVTDTGKGISPDFLPRVFDYFLQEDGKTTRKFGGLGLGLAIVRHLVELHGGTVQADSLGENQGATFTVKLPLQRSGRIGESTSERAGVQPLANPFHPYPLTGLRILVVDDDTDTRDFITFVLEQAGAEVIATTSANKALAALAQSQPNVLISDIGMPDIDGYTLMRQVRALPPDQGGTVPAIALTAYAGEFNQQQALQAGFQQHISKPVEPATLVSAITILLK